MKANLVSILLLFLIQLNNEQHLECGILTEVMTEGQRYIKIYDQKFSPIEELNMQNNALIGKSRLMPNSSFYINHWTDNEDFGTDLFHISGNEIDRIASISDRGIQPRPNAWSHNNRYVIFRTVGLNDDQLIVYDTLTSSSIRITEFSNVHSASWSPSQSLLAFVGFNRIVLDSPSLTENYGVHVVQADGKLIKTVNVDRDILARFHWLTGTLLAVETCDSGICQALIVDLSTGYEFDLTLGNHLLENFIEEPNSYLLSNLDDRNLSIYSHDIVSQLTFFDRIISRPTFSVSKHFVSFRAEIDGKYKLIIMRFLEPYEFTTIDLKSAIPALIRGNRVDDFDYMYNFNFLVDMWHPSLNQLIYEDDGHIYIYNTESSENLLIITAGNSIFTNPMWICQ